MAALDPVAMAGASLAALDLKAAPLEDSAVDVEAVAAGVLAAEAAATPCTALAALGDALTPAVGCAVDGACGVLREARGDRRVGYAVGPRHIATLWQATQETCGYGVGLDAFARGDLRVGGRVALEIFQCDGPVADWRCVYAPAIELLRGARDCAPERRAAEDAAQNRFHAGVVCGVKWSGVCRLGDVPESPLVVRTIGGDEASFPTGGAVLESIARLRDRAKLRPGARVLVAPPNERAVGVADDTVVVTFGGAKATCVLLEAADFRAREARVKAREAY